jgi:hypothetical protein
MLIQPDSWYTIEYKLSSINYPINRLPHNNINKANRKKHYKISYKTFDTLKPQTPQNINKNTTYNKTPKPTK